MFAGIVFISVFASAFATLLGLPGYKFLSGQMIAGTSIDYDLLMMLSAAWFAIGVIMYILSSIETVDDYMTD